MMLMSQFVIWAFIFNTSSYCGDIVLEREKRFKYLSHVLGMQKFPYWAGKYAFDLCIFFIPLLIFFVIIFAAGENTKFLTDVVGYLILGFTVFGLAFIGFAYLFSFAFQKSTTAYRLFPFINFLFFFVLPSSIVQSTQNRLFLDWIVPIWSPFMALYEMLLSDKIINQ